MVKKFLRNVIVFWIVVVVSTIILAISYVSLLIWPDCKWAYHVLEIAPIVISVFPIFVLYYAFMIRCYFSKRRTSKGQKKIKNYIEMFNPDYIIYTIGNAEKFLKLCNLSHLDIKGVRICLTPKGESFLTKNHASDFETPKFLAKFVDKEPDNLYEQKVLIFEDVILTGATTRGIIKHLYGPFEGTCPDKTDTKDEKNIVIPRNKLVVLSYACDRSAYASTSDFLTHSIEKCNEIDPDYDCYWRKI